MKLVRLPKLLNLLNHDDPILWDTDKYYDQKDPSPVAVPDKFNNKMIYHLYGTRGDDRIREWEMFHAVSPSPHGPWTEMEPIQTEIEGGCVAAPGGIYDEEDGKVHLFVQTDFLKLGGTIEHLESTDGFNFKHVSTVLGSVPGTEQAGVYDPQPIIEKDVNGNIKRHIVYTGMAQVSRGDIFLASSTTSSWDGPYETKKIIAHEQVEIHNQHDNPNYEWGLEGGCIVQLPNGKFWFVGVMFLSEGERGTRQRAFGALADDIKGPYQIVGPLVQPEEGENGHPGAIVEGETVRMFYQKRGIDQGWRVTERDMKVKEIMTLLAKSSQNRQYAT